MQNGSRMSKPPPARSAYFLDRYGRRGEGPQPKGYGGSTVALFRYCPRQRLAPYDRGRRHRRLTVMSLSQSVVSVYLILFRATGQFVVAAGGSGVLTFFGGMSAPLAIDGRLHAGKGRRHVGATLRRALWSPSGSGSPSEGSGVPEGKFGVAPYGESYAATYSLRFPNQSAPAYNRTG